MSTSGRTTAKSSQVTTPTDREIRVERIFNAPREQVWRAFTDPKLVAQWWGRGNRVVIERMEVERSVETATFEDLGDGRTKVVTTSLFHTAEERDGMLNSGMEEGLSESYAALDRLLATLD